MKYESEGSSFIVHRRARYWFFVPLCTSCELIVRNVKYGIVGNVHYPYHILALDNRNRKTQGWRQKRSKRDVNRKTQTTASTINNNTIDRNQQREKHTYNCQYIFFLFTI